jgi:hypothetical protein
MENITANFNRVFTIHDTSKHDFTINVMSRSSKPSPKKAIVAFYNNVEAVRSARLIEMHRTTHGTWPLTIMETTAVPDNTTSCNQLFIRSWADSSLRDYCQKNDLEILYLCNTNQDTLSISIESDP